MNLAGKRVLILGGNPETGVLVQVANRLGIHTIVVDPNPLAPAKRFAAESYDRDGFDVQGIADLALKVRADGVLVGVADILVEPYLQVCRRLNLPCYATEAAIAAFCSKDGFRDACRKFGVRDIPGFVLERETVVPDYSEMGFPLMVKPVDSGAGVGMRICSDPADLEKSISVAMASSRRGRVLIERYMSCEDVLAYYTFKDGKILLSAIADRITTKKQGASSPVCIGALYPSKHLQSFLDTAHLSLVEMFQGLGVRNGVLAVQLFVEGGRFHAYDPGFRLQGEAPHIPIKAINAFDHREMLLNFALTGSMGVEDLEERNDPYLRGKKACTIWVLLKGGVIRRIGGLDTIRNDPNVIFVLQRFGEGDRVTDQMVGTERQVLARIYVVGDSGLEIAEKVSLFRQSLVVLDSEGNDMIVDWMSPELLLS